MSYQVNITEWLKKIQEIQKPNAEKWEKKLQEKCASVRDRGALPRYYVTVRDSILDSSIQYRMDPGERYVFVALIVLAGTKGSGPVPGLISDNDLRSRPLDKVAHRLFIDTDLLLSTLEKAVEDDSIYLNGNGIFLTHFEDYQLTEYERQKPYRERKKRQAKAITPEEIEANEQRRKLHQDLKTK